MTADLAELEDRCLQLALKGSADPAHDRGHLMRVLRMARRIATAEGPFDTIVLTAAALLHDLVNLPKDHPTRALASQMSARAAVAALQEMGFDTARLDAVSHAIAAHSFSAGLTAVTAEAKALQDADRLDALGAIGVARMFAVSGQLGRALIADPDPLALSRPLDDQSFALDHLETKLFLLPERMQTATGRALAIERCGWMRQFQARVAWELE